MMSREDAKLRCNRILSVLAYDMERTLKEICKENNIYFPPEGYKSPRELKIRLIDDIYNSFESRVEEYTNENK